MSIPTTIVEEHHEAFIAWAHVFSQGLVTTPVTLLHFDDHADFKSPIFQRSIKGLLEQSQEAIKDFVYEEMKIDTFIQPALYCRLFDQFIWVRRDMKKNLCEKMWIRSYNDDGKKLIAGKASDAMRDEIGVHYFNCIKMDAKPATSMILPQIADYVLDIDLDYFSCCENPVIENEIIIEITRAEYEEFVRNKYHYLGLVFGSVKALASGGGHFYVINSYSEKYPSERQRSQPEIELSINELASTLLQLKAAPSAITICRSRHSGFTPVDQWQFIEDKLLRMLTAIYDLNVHSIGNLSAAMPNAIS